MCQPMSAIPQMRTFVDMIGMSALGQKQTVRSAVGMSDKGHKRTMAHQRDRQVGGALYDANVQPR